MGTKNTVSLSLSLNDVKLKLKQDKAEDFIISKVRPLNSGAYIPISGKHKDKTVIIIVLKSRTEI